MAEGESTHRGRPRDPEFETRVLDAAIALYADGGWTGFTFEAVARAAGVGKAGLYLRWPSREALLRNTLEARWLAPERIDTGSLRGDLLALARQVFMARTSAYAGAAIWMAIDTERHPEAAAATAPYGQAAVLQGRAIVRRAIHRGEIPQGADPGLLMDVVVGAVANHVATTPAKLRPAMIARMEPFTCELVDTILAGVAART